MTYMQTRFGVRMPLVNHDPANPYNFSAAVVHNIFHVIFGENCDEISLVNWAFQAGQKFSGAEVTHIQIGSGRDTYSAFVFYTGDKEAAIKIARETMAKVI